MPRVHRKGLGRRLALSHDQAMALLYGDCNGSDAFRIGAPRHLLSAFASPFARRSGWFAHRDELMADHNGGQRAWGYYVCELEVEAPSGGSEEAAWLRGRGLLEPWEEAQLRAISDTMAVRQEEAT